MAIDDYMKENVRRRRSKGIEELYAIIDDIKYCSSKSSNLHWFKPIARLRRAVYNRKVGQLLKCYDKEVDYMHIVYQHQAYNDALEYVLEKYKK